MTVKVTALLIILFVASGCSKYPSDIQKFTEPGVNINSDHVLIKEKVNELLGRETKTEMKVKILFEFVRDSIDEENSDSYKASDILRAGHGICYNKAILLTAMCRSAGIPARIAFDEIYIKDYMNSEKKVLTDIKFLHGITEIYFQGEWRKFDQTGNEKRWKIWTQGKPATFPLPLQFQTNGDVLFHSEGRVQLRRTNHHFFDWDIQAEKMILDFNRF